MLSDARFETSLPCSDLRRAKSFYVDKLGLTPADDGPAGAFYQGRDGSRFILFPSSGSASGSHSQMGFMVAEVRDLKQRGVQFEEYDFPGCSSNRAPRPSRGSGAGLRGNSMRSAGPTSRWYWQRSSRSYGAGSPTTGRRSRPGCSLP